MTLLDLVQAFLALAVRIEVVTPSRRASLNTIICTSGVA